MRFEAKNKEIKGYTTNCFKNVPYSLSLRHQQSHCYNLAGNKTFLYEGDEVFGGRIMSKL